MKYDKEAPSSIQLMFDSIAPRYDLANWCMTLGIHTLWNRLLAKKASNGLMSVNISPSSYTFLDLCCGTGDITFRLAQKANKEGSKDNKYSITGVDFSRTMVQIAESRIQTLQKHVQVAFTVGDATELKYSDNCADRVTMAYGIRNIQDRRKAFSEILRVLKPGGAAYILELSCPKVKPLQRIHRWYLQNIIPKIGSYICNNPQSHGYLSMSISHFIQPEDMVEEMKECGFESVSAEPLFFGVSTIYSGIKKKETFNA